MSIAHVQTVNSAMNTNASASTITETMTIGAGHLVVVWISSFTTTTTRTISSVVDDIGNTYVLAVSITANADRIHAIYYCPNVIGGVATVTVTFSGVAGQNRVALSEYSGVLLSSPLGSTINSDSGTSTAPAVTLSPADANSLYCGFVHVFSDVTITCNDNGRTEAEASLPVAAGDIVSASGSQTVDWTLGTSQTWRTMMATFKPALSGAGSGELDSTSHMNNNVNTYRQ